MIRILWFAGLRERIGEDETKMACAPISVKDLKARLKEQFPQFPGLDSAMSAVNEEYANDETVIHDGDTVAFIPPVSGG